jgi:hypothetical protein
MSWSITFIGKPENVANALEEQSTKLEGQSKVEYDSALPHMVALVKENFGTDEPIIKIAANGHGYSANGEQQQRQLVVTIERIYGTLV